MEVIGQFNNSFILCQLDKDLYILDQHACDEKSNYEHLMNEVAIHSQKLIKFLLLCCDVSLGRFRLNSLPTRNSQSSTTRPSSNAMDSISPFRNRRSSASVFNSPRSPHRRNTLSPSRTFWNWWEQWWKPEEWRSERRSSPRFSPREPAINPFEQEIRSTIPKWFQ